MVSSYRDLMIGRYVDEVLPLTALDLDALDLQVKLIALLSGLTEAEVLALPIADYTERAAAISFLTEPCDASRARIPARYTLGDLVLVPTTDYTKMTAGQFIDFQTLSKEPEKNTVPLLSVFLVPEGKAYGVGYDVAEVRRAIAERLSVQDALEALAFFFGRLPQLLRDSLTFSERAAKGLKDRRTRKEMLAKIAAVKASLSAGGGLQT